MKMSFFIVLLLFSGLASSGQVVWAQQTWGNQEVFHESDGAGNTFLTCSFSGDSIFQNVSIGNGGIAFVKYNASGKLIWANKSFGPALEVYANALDKNGNYYVAGDYDFAYPGNFGVGNFSIPNNGDQDNIFLVKLDTGGNAVWLKAIGGLGANFVSDLTVDDSANVYLIGSYDSTFQVDGVTVGPGGPTDGFWGHYFLAKFSNDGHLQWVNTNICQVNSSLKIDRKGNMVFAGDFQNYNYCSDTVFRQVLGGEIYIEKQRPDGTRKWITLIKNDTSGFNYQQLLDVRFDNENNLYLLTTLPERVSIGDSVLRISSSGNFIVKFDEDGNFKWVNRVTTPEDSLKFLAQLIYVTTGDALHSINRKYQIDSSLYIAYDWNTGLLDSTWQITQVSYGYYDYLLDKNTGDTISSKLLYGMPSVGNTVQTDSADNLYFYISFASYFIVDTDTFTTSEWGAYSSVLIKYKGEQPDTIVPPLPQSGFWVAPNPTRNALSIMPAEPGNYSLQLFDLYGKMVQSSSVHSGFTTIGVGNLAAAVYVLRITGSTGATFNAKIVKQ